MQLVEFKLKTNVILTKVSIFSTSVGNFVLDIAGWLAVIFVDPFSLQISFLSFLEAFVWLEVVLFIQTRCTIWSLKRCFMTSKMAGWLGRLVQVSVVSSDWPSSDFSFFLAFPYIFLRSLPYSPAYCRISEVWTPSCPYHLMAYSRYYASYTRFYRLLH